MFTIKDWRNDPDNSTPLSAAALEDLETRLAAYTDSELATHLADTTAVHGIANTAAIGAANLGGVPRCRAVETAAQTIANNTATSLTFTAADTFDTDTMHDTSTNPSRVTATTAGVYLVIAKVGWTAHATGGRTLWLRHNGSTNTDVVEQVATVTVNQAMMAQGIFELTAGQYMEARVLQSSGGNLDTQNSQGIGPRASLTLIYQCAI